MKRRHLVLLVTLASFVLVTIAVAEAPSSISYQGRLTTIAGSPIPDGSYTVLFTIYDAATGGISKWIETQSVTTSGGLFSVLLGSVSPISDTVFGGTTRSLGIKVGADPEMTPRITLVSVPYAHRVKTIDGATGGTISGYTLVSRPEAGFANVLTLASNANTANLDIIPEAAGTGVINVNSSDASLALAIGNNRHLTISNGGNVGIGTTSPSSKLEVVGDLTVSGNIIGSTPWTAFPFASGYDNYEDAHGGGTQRVEYRKIGDIVYIRGTVHKADHSLIPALGLCGTLPVGFRPPAIVVFLNAPTPGGVYIYPTGEIKFVYNGPNELQYLDGIFFSTTP